MVVAGGKAQAAHQAIAKYIDGGDGEYGKQHKARGHHQKPASQQGAHAVTVHIISGDGCHEADDHQCHGLARANKGFGPTQVTHPFARHDGDGLAG